jgi:hypothetical protein
LVAVNNGTHAQTVKLTVTNAALENCSKVKLLLGTDPPPKFNDDSLLLTLQPNDVAVLEIE